MWGLFPYLPAWMVQGLWSAPCAGRGAQVTGKPTKGTYMKGNLNKPWKGRKSALTADLERCIGGCNSAPVQCNIVTTWKWAPDSHWWCAGIDRVCRGWTGQTVSGAGSSRLRQFMFHYTLSYFRVLICYCAAGRCKLAWSTCTE